MANVVSNVAPVRFEPHPDGDFIALRADNGLYLIRVILEANWKRAKALKPLNQVAPLE